MSGIPLLTALGDAIAAAILFALALVFAIVGVGVAGLLLALRRSLRSSLLGLGAAIVVFGVTASTSENQAMAVSLGAVAFAATFVLVRRRVTSPDPVRLLNHRVAAAAIALIALATTGAVLVMWTILVGGLGRGVVTLFADHPYESLMIGMVTVATAAVLWRAVRDIQDAQPA